jgi:hypothetical protein
MERFKGGVSYRPINWFVKDFKRRYSDFGLAPNAGQLRHLFGHYKLKPVKLTHTKADGSKVQLDGFSEKEVMNMCTRKEGFRQTLENLLKYGNCNGPKEDVTEDIEICEDSNPAFERKKGMHPEIVKCWKEIDEAQNRLQELLYGKELETHLDELTMAKVKAMGKMLGFNTSQASRFLLKVPSTLFHAGNSKLPKNVLIVNMSSALMCPAFYNGTCKIKKGACYAMALENQYSTIDMEKKGDSAMSHRFRTDVMYTRMLDMYERDDNSALRLYFDIIKKYIRLSHKYGDIITEKTINDVKTTMQGVMTPEMENTLRMVGESYKIKDVRLNESGDFQCQLAVDVWGAFSKELKAEFGIDTHAYTARLLDYTGVKDDIAINASHDNVNTGDNKRKFICCKEATFNSLEGGEGLKSFGVPNLGVRETRNGTEYFYKCPCSYSNEDVCGTCGVCYKKNNTGVPYTIYITQHGSELSSIKNLFSKKQLGSVMKAANKKGWNTPEEQQASKGKEHNRTWQAMIDNSKAKKTTRK